MQSETTLTFPISFELPTDLKVRICDAITLFSRVESAALEAVWTLEHADLIRKKKIARMSAKNGFKALRGFFAGVTEAQESRLWVTLDELTDERNLIAHGVWMTDATGAVAVVWHSRFLESENFVGAELFPAVRFEQFSQIATHSLSLFAQIRSMYE